MADKQPSTTFGLLNVMTPSEVTAAKAVKAKDSSIVDGTEKTAEVAANLAGYIRKCWEEAKREKVDIETQMMKNMRQIAGQYEVDMLAHIRAADAPEYFMMLTDAKCRAAEAWIKEVICQPGYKPWDLEPTPSPELPEDVVNTIRQKFISQTFQTIATMIAAKGEEVDPMGIFGSVRSMLPKFEEEMNALVKKEAKRRTEKIKEKVDDALTEGGWYEAIEEFVGDVVRLKNGFVKGPIKRREPTLKVKVGTGGKYVVKVKEEIIDRYERRSPFNIYPQPKSTNIEDGYLIDLISFQPRDLEALKGIDGYNSTNIDLVLSTFRTGGLREWLSFESEKKAIEGSGTQFLHAGENIDCLEFWGTVQGKLLKEWGMAGNNIMELGEYDICAWLIKDIVVGAILNPDPLRKKPFSKVAYKEKADCFWGDGLPEIIVDNQRGCNSATRAIIQNTGIASGPQVEVNIERLAPGESKKLTPWRVWFTTDDQMNTGKAINFYSPPMVVERLIMVYNFFSKLADEYSGVPAYAHGDPQVGGGGNTASGLSMLITQAARGIKNLIKNIDTKVISKTVRAQFFREITQHENIGIVPDFKIVAKGATALLAKEQQSIRRVEFMQMTNNPTDITLMGPEGRKYLLRSTARSMDLEEDMVVPGKGMFEEDGPNMGQLGQPIASQPKPQTLGPDGNPVVGQDFRQFNEGGV